MSRYNKIFAGPAEETRPYVHEAPAANGNIKPGCLIVLDGSGDFDLAGATTVGKVWLAQDNYLALKGVDVAYATGDVVMGLELLDKQLFNVRVANGFNVAKGAALTPAANGLVAAASTSDLVIGYADETYNNTSGAEQLVRMRPATNGHLTAAA